MKFFAPAVSKDAQHFKNKSSNRKYSLLNRAKRGHVDGMMQLKIKDTLKTGLTKRYIRNYSEGRRPMRSKKNFTIVEVDDNEMKKKWKKERLVCQFGKLDDNRFFLDVEYPLSPLQAFSLALASLKCD